jgi:hypothetical protein
MAPAGGRDVPADLLPGSRNPGVQPTGPGAFGDAQQRHSPIDIADSSSRPPWANPGTPGSDSYHHDDRVGRPVDDARNRPAHRERSRPKNGAPGGKSPGSSTTRICKKCGEPLLGQFVRALGATFHLECYQCQVSLASCLTDCGAIICKHRDIFVDTCHRIVEK